MRIIGGTKKGARLKAPRGLSTRPLLARIRKSLFSILGPHLPEASFLDLFAGSGAVGLEALSRGAARALFVDNSPRCVGVIEENVEKLGLQARTEVLKMDFRGALHLLQLREESFHIIFSGPPFGRGLSHQSMKLVAELELARDDGIVVIESSAQETLRDQYGCYRLGDRRHYTNVVLWFYKRQ